MDSTCINPDVSLMELISMKKKLQNGIKVLTVGQVWDDVKKDHETRIAVIDARIRELEIAAHTHGQCIRLV